MYVCCSVALSKRRIGVSSSSMILYCVLLSGERAPLEETPLICKFSVTFQWNAGGLSHYHGDSGCTYVCLFEHNIRNILYSCSRNDPCNPDLNMRYKFLWQAPLSVCSLSKVQHSLNSRSKRQLDQLQQDLATLTHLSEISKQLRTDHPVSDKYPLQYFPQPYQLEPPLVMIIHIHHNL